MTIIVQPTYQILIFGPQATPDFTHFNLPGVDAGSSISGGRFTEERWVPSRVISRQEKNVIIDGIREEARRKLAEDKQLSAIGRAERDVRLAQQECDRCEADFNRSPTRTNHTKRLETSEKLQAATAKVHELNSIEYMEKLWADYHAKKGNRGRN